MLLNYVVSGRRGDAISFLATWDHLSFPNDEVETSSTKAVLRFLMENHDFDKHLISILRDFLVLFSFEPERKIFSGIAEDLWRMRVPDELVASFRTQVAPYFSTDDVPSVPKKLGKGFLDVEAIAERSFEERVSSGKPLAAHFKALLTAYADTGNSMSAMNLLWKRNEYGIYIDKEIRETMMVCTFITLVFEGLFGYFSFCWFWHR